MNLLNFVKITKLTTVNFFNSWYSLQYFESKLALLVSIILSGYLLPYLLSMCETKGISKDEKLTKNKIARKHIFNILSSSDLSKGISEAANGLNFVVMSQYL